MSPTPTPVIIRPVPIEAIDRSRNHRLRPEDEPEIRGLMDSIRSAGQLQPVRVYEAHPDYQPDCRHEYVLGFGARRCEAIERLGLRDVLAIVHPAAPDEKIEAARAVENLHRKDITPIEEAMAVEQVIRAVGRDNFATEAELHEEVASQLGRSVRWVQDHAYFSRLTPAVRELAMAAELPAGHLREIAKVGDPYRQLNIAGRVSGLDEQALRLDDDTEVDDCLRAHLQEDLDRIREKSFRRQTLAETQKLVQAGLGSLRRVQWDLSLRIIDDEQTLPPCDGCPHNSATDPDLFGFTTGEEAICSNPTCYEAKARKADEAREELRKKFVRGKRSKMPSAEEVREAAPAILDPKKAAGFVRREVKKALEDKPARSTSAGGGDSGREPTEHEKALVRFATAEDAWCEIAAKRVWEAMRAHDRYESWLAFWITDAIRAEMSWASGWGHPVVNYWAGNPCTVNPTPPKEISAGAEKLLAAMREGVLGAVHNAPVTVGSWVEISVNLVDVNPLLMTRVIEILGVQIDPAPTWADFAPKGKPEPANEAPAGKKAAGKKKAGSKKKGKKGKKAKGKGVAS